MIARGIAGRIAKLERYRRPRSSYVLHLSTPPKQKSWLLSTRPGPQGRRFAVLPRTCASVEEWLANCAPREALQ